MKAGKKIGIIGGAFDPIHNGHLLIAENALQQYALDEVWFMPSGHSPHAHKQNLTDAVHRVKMVELAIHDNPSFCLTEREIKKKETNYTYQTMEALNREYKEDEFYFIIGGDSLHDFYTWRHPEKILASCKLLAAVRDDIVGDEFEERIKKMNEDCKEERIFAVRTPNFSVSSNQIRKLVKENKTIRYMVPNEVRTYILENGLYQD